VEQLKPLEERLKAIESQPAGKTPVRSYTVVDKVAETPVTNTEEADLMAKAADMEANPSKYSISERSELANQLLKQSVRRSSIQEIQ
jgi:hypothetical protein